MTDLFDRANRQFTACCVREPRYRVAWLTGSPMSRKSTLARQLCTANGWHYLDYTTTPGYFDSLVDTISTYRPEDLTAALRDWCAACPAPVLIVDEIDAVLATWTLDQRTFWANQVSRLTYLPCGVIIVTHILSCSMLTAFLPDGGQHSCLNLTREAV